VSEPALRAVGLAKRFGRSIALAGVDLELPQGVSLAVLGPNGAGKSTLLRLIAGLARPSSGSLCVAGTPAHRPAARARVGFIGHASLLYPSLTARENLLFAARLQRVEAAALRVEQLLESSGLARVADVPIAGFSRGMSQRLSIARGLIHDPPVLLLDEPFTGLDPRAAAALAERLAALRAAGRTLVLVTHDPKRAAELADRAIVLAAGRVVFERRSGEGGAETLERAVLEAGDGAA
jgi:heme exporter protein A